MKDKEKEKAVEWAKRQRKKGSIDIPERERDEEPINEKQIKYIIHLAPNVDIEEVKKLGKWQASAIIDDIKSQQDQFTDEMTDKYKRGQSRGCLGTLIILISLISSLLGGLLIVWITVLKN